MSLFTSVLQFLTKIGFVGRATTRYFLRVDTTVLAKTLKTARKFLPVRALNSLYSRIHSCIHGDVTHPEQTRFFASKSVFMGRCIYKYIPPVNTRRKNELALMRNGGLKIKNLTTGKKGVAPYQARYLRKNARCF